MFARVTIKDYLQFLVYGLEYRALVMEQMSHEKEKKYLAEHSNVEDREDGYGVVLLNFCIRDLQGESRGPSQPPVIFVRVSCQHFWEQLSTVSCQHFWEQLSTVSCQSPMMPTFLGDVSPPSRR